MNTYFVLNKKDRLGTIQPRPFQLVLAEMKRQEIEEAKLKQTANLKHENLLNPTRKENGLNELSTPINSKSTESEEIPFSVKTNNNENIPLDLVQNSLLKPLVNNDQIIKPLEHINESSQSVKSLQGQSRSRTCELL